MTGREKQRTANHSVQLRGMIRKTVCCHKGRERERRGGRKRAKGKEGGREGGGGGGGEDGREVDGTQGREH